MMASTEDARYRAERVLETRRQWVEDGCPRDMVAWLRSRGLVVEEWEENEVQPDHVAPGRPGEG